MGGFLIQRFGYNASFLGLSAVGLVAFLVLWLLPRDTCSIGAYSLPQGATCNSMKIIESLPIPLKPDASGIILWARLGHPHLTTCDERRLLGTQHGPNKNGRTW
jgi:hypothetical protein